MEIGLYKLVDEEIEIVKNSYNSKRKYGNTKV